jgi:hypothetical protein
MLKKLDAKSKECRRSTIPRVLIPQAAETGTMVYSAATQWSTVAEQRFSAA